MNQAEIDELNDPETLMMIRQPMPIQQLAKVSRLFKNGEAVIKAMPSGCRWLVIKKAVQRG